MRLSKHWLGQLYYRPPRGAAASMTEDEIKKLRKIVLERLTQKRTANHIIAPDPMPRYDEIYAAGVAWLNGSQVKIRNSSDRGD